MTPVLAVAGNLLRELRRKPSAVAFAALIAALAAALPHLENAGTLRARLQVAVAHGAGLPVFLIALAAVFLAAGSMAHDVERGAIQSLAVKPIRRSGILLGKLAGCAAAAGALLALVFIALAINVRVLREGSGPGAPGEDEAARERFFTPRRSVPASVPELDRERLQRFLQGAGKPAPDGSEREAEVQARRALARPSVAPGGAVPVVFVGLSARGEPGAAGDREAIILRFVLFAPSTRGSGSVECIWEAPGEDGGPARFAERVTAAVGLPREIRVPADLVEDGKLALVLRNPEGAEAGGPYVVDLARTEALEAHGAFLPNAARCFLLLLARLVFLAAVGILGGALFTFPTAALLGSFVYLTAVASSFLREAFSDLWRVHDGSTFERVAAACARAGEAILGVLPDFSSFDPLGRLAAGRAVTAGELAAHAGWTVGAQAGAVVLVACLLFARRELARKGEA